MDELLKQLLLGAPNLIALIWIVWRDGKRQEKYDDFLLALIERLSPDDKDEDV